MVEGARHVDQVGITTGMVWIHELEHFKSVKRIPTVM